MTPAELRSRTGFHAWLAWSDGIGLWAPWGKQNPAVRPNVPRDIKRHPKTLTWFALRKTWWAARRAAASPYPKPAPVLLENAVYTVTLSNFHGQLRDAARAKGFSVLLVLLDGDPEAPGNLIELRKIRGELEGNGWKIGGWAPTYDPAQARRAAELCASERLALWGPNLEDWAEHERAWLTPAWLEAFVPLAPEVPITVSCLSSTTANYARSFDYVNPLRHGAIISPQVYGSVHAGYAVSAMNGMLDKASVPAAHRKPTFSIYDNIDRALHDYRTWPGPYDVYIGERLEAAKWRLLP